MRIDALVPVLRLPKDEEMKYYIIAGEASGDLHASNLMKSLREKDPQAEFRGFGGDLMRAQGAFLLRHYRDLAYMGFVEVAVHIGTILRNIRLCKKDLLDYRPDVLILVDYPGFNMRIAPFAHRHGIRTVYYIAPQVWAWRTGRIKKLKKYTDKIFTLLPFERRFYEAYEAEAFFEGNPLVDSIRAYRPDEAFVARYRNSDDTRPLVVILPGSRKQEIKRIFPLMLRVAGKLQNYRYVVAGTPHLPEALYRSYLKDYPQVELVFGHTYDLFSVAHAGMIKSGTSTLEAAMFSLPQVVCYSVNPISYRIGRMVVNKDVRFISLVNLIMDREVVRELLQKDFNEKELENELLKICEDENRRKLLTSEYAELQAIMGEGGTSSRVAASIISQINDIRKR